MTNRNLGRLSIRGNIPINRMLRYGWFRILRAVPRSLWSASSVHGRMEVVFIPVPDLRVLSRAVYWLPEYLSGSGAILALAVLLLPPRNRSAFRCPPDYGKPKGIAFAGADRSSATPEIRGSHEYVVLRCVEHGVPGRRTEEGRSSSGTEDATRCPAMPRERAHAADRTQCAGRPWAAVDRLWVSPALVVVRLAGRSETVPNLNLLPVERAAA